MTDASATKQRFKAIVDAHLLLVNSDDVLLGQRQNTGFGDGAWHPPSGHLEAGESVLAALIREAKEEIGVAIADDDVELAHVMHNASGEGRIAFFFTVRRWQGQPTNREPDKCAELRWFPFIALPDQMIGYARVALEHYAAGRALSTYGWSAG